MINVGCLHCEIGTQIVGVFKSEKESKIISENLIEVGMGIWADGGENLYVSYRVSDACSMHKRPEASLLIDISSKRTIDWPSKMQLDIQECKKDRLVNFIGSISDYLSDLSNRQNMPDDISKEIHSVYTFIKEKHDLLSFPT